MLRKLLEIYSEIEYGVFSMIFSMRRFALVNGYDIKNKQNIILELNNAEINPLVFASLHSMDAMRDLLNAGINPNIINDIKDRKSKNSII